MSLTCITCTSDRPWAIARAEYQMARQTLEPDEWIVADDGQTPARLTMGQQHLRLSPQSNGSASLAHNLQAAVLAAHGDSLVIIEDDDWYHPRYLEECQQRLAEADAVGEPSLRYYNVRERGYVTFPNAGCSGLFQTALSRELIPTLLDVIHQAMASGGYDIDGRFWRALAAEDRRLYDKPMTVGIKGMPGKAGLGVGHRPLKTRRKGLRAGSNLPYPSKLCAPWIGDPSGDQLRAWIGEEADFYLTFDSAHYG